MAQLSAATIPPVRVGNKAQAAEFFDVSLPTIEAWIRRGAPVEQRGSRGVSWVIDLRAFAEWVYGAKAGADGDSPEDLPPKERKDWFESETKRRALQVRDRELIPAAEVEQAVATAFAALAQDLRAIPDNLERKAGVAPAVAERVEAEILDAMDAMADRLAALAPVGGEADEQGGE